MNNIADINKGVSIVIIASQLQRFGNYMRPSSRDKPLIPRSKLNKL